MRIPSRLVGRLPQGDDEVDSHDETDELLMARNGSEAILLRYSVRGYRASLLNSWTRPGLKRRAPLMVAHETKGWYVGMRSNLRDCWSNRCESNFGRFHNCTTANTDVIVHHCCYGEGCSEILIPKTDFYLLPIRIQDLPTRTNFTI